MARYTYFDIFASIGSLVSCPDCCTTAETARPKPLARNQNAASQKKFEHQLSMLLIRMCTAEEHGGEHVAEPFKAARGLFNLVAPAGIVLWCAPSMVRSHAKPKKSPHGKSYGDYFRYTHQGAQSLLERAGFKIVAAESWGDNELSSAYLLGFGADDVGGKRLASRMRRPDGADRKSLLKNLHVWTFKTCVVAMKPEAIPSA